MIFNRIILLDINSIYLFVTSIMSICIINAENYNNSRNIQRPEKLAVAGDCLVYGV